jgi:hypothetical protein
MRYGTRDWNGIGREYIAALTELRGGLARKQRALMRGQYVIVGAVGTHFVVNSTRKIIRRLFCVCL